MPLDSPLVAVSAYVTAAVRRETEDLAHWLELDLALPVSASGH